MTSRLSDQDKTVSIDLSAVVVAVSDDEPRVLTVGGGDSLPFGAFVSGHRTLELGLRAWVADQTGLELGYVEQLYTFADLDRAEDGVRAVSVSYLALVRAGRLAPGSDAAWQDWYRYFPWEDWRNGPPAVLDEVIRPRLESWVAATASPEARARRAERCLIAFGQGSAGWSDEQVLERFELLYESGLAAEAQRRRGKASPDLATGRPMRHDHRRILATAIARLRAKIKYRPVVFELMPPAFTLLKLQRTVEGLAGTPLHKQNFRRLIAQQGLVEETGAVETETGGRPAKQVRFRREVLQERPAPGVRLRAPGQRKRGH
jgi:hypothetical protein